MDRRGGGEGEVERWGVADGGGSVRRRRRRRNVHEFFSFYCTFSIILRNSGKEAGKCAELLICEQFKAWEFCFVFILWNGNIKPRRQLAGTNVLILSLQELGSTGVGGNHMTAVRLPSKSSMPSAFLSPSFISSSISSSVMGSPVLRMMRANSSLSM